MRLILFALASVLTVGCSTKAPTPPDAPPVVVGGIPTIDCSSSSWETKHASKPNGWSRTVVLPASGKFVEESHYVTKADKFPSPRLFANTGDENIGPHLMRACALYQQRVDAKMTCERLHPHKYARVWTPAEGGKIGQGSRGESQAAKLEPWDEMWQVNMMWASGWTPPPGTRFVAQAGGKAVVVQGGWEVGPGAEKWLGGVTGEVHRYLGTSNESTIKLSYLKDQNIPVGPANCR